VVKRERLTVAKMKSEWQYAGLPIVIAALIILHAGSIDAFFLLWHISVVVFSYIAAVIDMKTRRIPNALVLTMLAAWILIMTPKLFLDVNTVMEVLIDSVLGFVFGGGIFLLVYIISRRGLGGGDVKFMAMAGLYLGFGGTIPAILYGTILATLVGFALILSKKIGRKDTMPLAPFICVGILITLFLR
jgi:prepilin signal peptidase PulO-like enzyme (type II secretory pathway)